MYYRTVFMIIKRSRIENTEGGLKNGQSRETNNI